MVRWSFILKAIFFYKKMTPINGVSVDFLFDIEGGNNVNVNINR